VRYLHWGGEIRHSEGKRPPLNHGDVIECPLVDGEIEEECQLILWLRDQEVGELSSAISIVLEALRGNAKQEGCIFPLQDIIRLREYSAIKACRDESRFFESDDGASMPVLHICQGLHWKSRFIVERDFVTTIRLSLNYHRMREEEL